MSRVVLDVNVLVSGFPADQGVPAELIEFWLAGAFELVLSEHILAGAARAWAKPYYASRYSADEVQLTLVLLRARATIVVPVNTVQGIGDDEEDDLILATAVAGRATYLVTGDKGLQDLVAYEGIIVLSPRAFLDLLTP